MRPASLSCLPLITGRSSSVSLPHFSLTLPVSCFQLPSILSQFMTEPLAAWSRIRADTWQRSLVFCGCCPQTLCSDAWIAHIELRGHDRRITSARERPLDDQG